MRIVNIANGTRLPAVWTDPFIAGLQQLGTVALVEWGGDLADREAVVILRDADVAIVGWDARPLPATLAEDAGSLQYVCCYSGTIQGLVPRVLIESGLVVSNWGDLPAAGVAEGAMTLLLAMLHEVPQTLDVQRAGGYGIDLRRHGGLHGLAVGVYGCGVVGRRFLEMLAPFGARTMVYDPYASDLPEAAERAQSLAELCEWSEVLVIHAGWSEETNGSVTEAHLARLPDNGLVINTARGGIIDQPALFSEVLAGRLRAGLDVLEPEELAADHAIRSVDNCLLSFHTITTTNWPDRPGLDAKQQRVLDQVRRFVDGVSVQHTFDLDRYDRST